MIKEHGTWVEKCHSFLTEQGNSVMIEGLVFSIKINSMHSFNDDRVIGP